MVLSSFASIKTTDSSADPKAESPRICGNKYPGCAMDRATTAAAHILRFPNYVSLCSNLILTYLHLRRFKNDETQFILHDRISPPPCHLRNTKKAYQHLNNSDVTCKHLPIDTTSISRNKCHKYSPKEHPKIAAVPDLLSLNGELIFRGIFDPKKEEDRHRPKHG